MLQVLLDTHALARIAPMLVLDGAPESWAVLDQAAQAGLPLAGRYALLGRTASNVAALSSLWKVPSECADQARLLPVVLAAAAETGAGRLDALETCDALRKPERFLALLDAASLLVPVDIRAWRQALDAVRGVDAGAIAAALREQPQAIRAAVRQARAMALQALPE
jgi:tRNA nucleotidyltransferase (CCA-adding enzyme)